MHCMCVCMCVCETDCYDVRCFHLSCAVLELLSAELPHRSGGINEAHCLIMVVTGLCEERSD